MKSFINAEIVLANVKDFLSSFDKVNLIDDSDLYRWIAWVNNRLGIGSLMKEDIVLKVENYKAALPDDFDLLWAVSSCNVIYEDSNNNPEFTHTVKYITKEWSNLLCTDECSCCRDNTEKTITQTWKLKSEDTSIPVKFSEGKLLKLGLGVNKNHIHKDCLNVNNECTDEFSIDNNYIHFNFDNCFVYLQYYKKPLDENGIPLILDDEYVLQALEDYLIFKSLQKIFINGNADVMTRMQYYQNEHKFSLKECLFNCKLDSFTDLVNAAKRRGNYLKVYNLKSRSDGRIHKS